MFVPQIRNKKQRNLKTLRQNRKKKTQAIPNQALLNMYYIYDDY